MWDAWPVASFYLIQLPHDIRRDMGQIADAGDHHGIHELAFERIQEEFDPFRSPADSRDGSWPADEDGVGAEGQNTVSSTATTTPPRTRGPRWGCCGSTGMS